MGGKRQKVMDHEKRITGRRGRGGRTSKNLK
jgi:hypothetical protein